MRRLTKYLLGVCFCSGVSLFGMQAVGEMAHHLILPTDFKISDITKVTNHPFGTESITSPELLIEKLVLKSHVFNPESEYVIVKITPNFFADIRKKKNRTLAHTDPNAKEQELKGTEAYKPATATASPGNTISMVATAYSCGTKTASGAPVHVGAIAVDRSRIPFGTRMRVWHGGQVVYEGVACDTGGAIKGNKIDLYWPSEAQCRAWGRKTVQVEILSPAPAK